VTGRSFAAKNAESRIVKRQGCFVTQNRGSGFPLPALFRTRRGAAPAKPLRLLRQAHAQEQILESWVVAQRIVDWIDLQSRQRIGMLYVSFFQPC
jgi:hypothetical protein